MKYFLPVFFAILLTHCGGNKKGSEEPKQDSVETRFNVDSLSELAQAECLSLKEYQFCPFGLDFIKIGDSLVYRTFSVAGAVQKDTVFEEAMKGFDPPQTADWNVIMLNFDDGKVILESDFEEDRFLNRIQIETPRYTTPTGLHVGMTFGELLEKEPGLQVGSYVDKNVVLGITPVGYIFHFKNNGYFDSSQKEDKQIDPGKMDKNEKVIRITVM